MDNDDILTEFSIPNSELSAEMTIGDYGKLSFTVEVIGNINGMTIFRKHNKAIAEGNFKPESAKLMRERLLTNQDAEDAAEGEPKD